MSFCFHVGSKNFYKLFSVSDSMSMIVSRFTSLIEDFVISCYRVTKFFCSRHDRTSAFSARGPRYFGPHADLAIFDLREVTRNTVLDRYHFSSRP